MSRIVMALSGWKGSGKDTAADYLVSEYGFRKLSFAAALKDMVSITYNVPREYLDSPTHKEMPLHHLPVDPTDLTSERLHNIFRTELRNGFWTPRALCILEGSVKRAVMPNYWIQAALEKIINDPTTSYVITDMRYRNEAETVRLFFPHLQVIRIKRFDTSPTEDPSERDMDNYLFDELIINKGTYDELYKQVDTVITRLSSTF